MGPNCGILVWSCLTVRLLRDIIFYSLLISSEGLTARMNQLELAQFIASLNHTDSHMLRYRTHDRAFNVVAALRICQERSLEQFRNQRLITQRAFAKVITHNGEYLLALFEWLILTHMPDVEQQNASGKNDCKTYGTYMLPGVLEAMSKLTLHPVLRAYASHSTFLRLHSARCWVCLHSLN